MLCNNAIKTMIATEINIARIILPSLLTHHIALSTRKTSVPTANYMTRCHICQTEL